MGRLRCLLYLLVLAALLTLPALTGCVRRDGTVPVDAVATPPAPTAPERAGSAADDGGLAEDSRRDTLTLAIPPAEGRYDPFFSDTAGDRLVLRLTQLPVMALTADGSPAVPADQAPGAACVKLTLMDDGSAVCRLSMREDIRFADGSYADVDDLLFTYGVLLDPDYDGPHQAADCDIHGLALYRTATDAALYEKYIALYPEAAAGLGPFAAQAEASIRAAWQTALRELTVYCRDTYLEDYAHYALGLAPQAVLETPGALLVFTMWCAGLAENADADGVVWDVMGGRWAPGAGVLPDETELLTLFQQVYEAPAAFDAALGTHASARAEEGFVRSCAAQDPAYAGGPAAVPGLQRVDDYTLEITLDSWQAGDLDRLCGGYLVSRRAGDPALGGAEVTFGGLRALKAAGSAAVWGAGAYVPGDYGGGLTANTAFYRGTPQIRRIRLVEMPEESMLDAVARGDADAALISGTRERFDRVRDLCGGKLAGAGLTALPVSTHVYGYVQLADAGADAALRQALLTAVCASCRESAAAYYGDAASIPGGGKTAAELYAALERQLAQSQPGPWTLAAYVAGDGLGDHPCYAGLLAAAEALLPLQVTLTVTDAADRNTFWAAVDEGQAALWAAAQQGADMEETDRMLVYEKQDMALFRTRRVELSTVPARQTIYQNWLDSVETLTLRQTGNS